MAFNSKSELSGEQKQVFDAINGGQTELQIRTLCDKLNIRPKILKQIIELVNKESSKKVVIKTTSAPSTTNAQSGYQSNIVVDNKANEETLYIMSLISGDLFFLNGIIEDISMGWNSTWTEETVYGRTDPIPTYSHTGRTLGFAITLSSNVVTESNRKFETKKENYIKLNAIANMCYPGYDLSKGNSISGIIKAPPLVGIKHGNIIQGQLQGPDTSVVTNFQKAYIKSFSVTFENKGLYDLGVNNEKYYNRIKVNFEFGLLHDHMVGFGQDGRPLVNEMERKGNSYTLKPGEIEYPFKIKEGD